MTLDLGPEFWTGLLQMTVANILLSGDNALVIALAARSLPPQHQRIAILGGSAGAIVLRIILSIFVAELMQLSYLKLIGGALLLWIGAKLLVEEEEDAEGGDDHSKAGLWAAVQTIIIADLVMSLDNVIALAAAAKGNTTLLIIGLGISIPLVIFGSTLIIKVLEKFPIVITLGGGLLGWIAGDVMIDDNAVKPFFEAYGAAAHYGVPALCAVGTVVAGTIWSRLKASAAAHVEHVTDLANEPSSQKGTSTKAGEKS